MLSTRERTIPCLYHLKYYISLKYPLHFDTIYISFMLMSHILHDSFMFVNLMCLKEMHTNVYYIMSA